MIFPEFRYYDGVVISHVDRFKNERFIVKDASPWSRGTFFTTNVKVPSLVCCIRIL